MLQPFNLTSISKCLADWAEQHASLESQAESLAARRDAVTLLTFVRDKKVVGTQGTGNMPLKAVREVTALFVDPPPLDSTIGDRTFALRTEEEVWPLHFLRILTEVGKLLKVGSARRWQLTPQANRFLATPPLIQAAFLLNVWWYRVNWLIAYPFSGMGNHLPHAFTWKTLTSLRALPTGTDIPFEEHAKALIQSTGLTWASEGPYADISLRGSIQRMVISILTTFGALECRYRTEPAGRGTVNRLESFQITPWGKALLDAVALVGG